MPINSHFSLYSVPNPYNDIFKINIYFNYGTLDNPDINNAIAYLEQLGADSMDLQQLNQQLNLYGAHFSLSSDNDNSYLYISGLEQHLDSILALCHRWLTNPRHDKKQLKILLDGMKSNKKAYKNDADSWFSALKAYVNYGDQSYYLRSTPYKQWGKRTGEELHREVMQIFTRNGYVTFSGNTQPSDLVEKLVRYHLVPDSVTDMPSRDYKRKQYTSPQLFFSTNKKFLQSNINITAPSTMFDTLLHRPDGAPSDQALVALFNEYFGSGMNSVIFQEIREFRSLGYSTGGAFSYYMLNLNPAYTYTYLGTQCDKTLEGVEALRDLMTTFPERPEKLQPAIQHLIVSRNSNYITFRSLPGMVRYWVEKRGWNRDHRAELTEQISQLTLHDLRAFHAKYIKDRPLVVTICGNAKKFDPKAVARLLGPDVTPTEVTFDQMFRF